MGNWTPWQIRSIATLHPSKTLAFSKCQQVVWAGSCRTFFCFSVSGGRSNGNGSGKKKKVIARVLLTFMGRSPSSEVLEGSSCPASCACRTSLELSWIGAYTIESFPLYVLELGTKFFRNRLLILSLPQSSHHTGGYYPESGL